MATRTHRRVRGRAQRTARVLGRPDHPPPQSALDPTRRTIVVCASGARASLAALTLKTMGYQNVAVLDGGLKGWIKRRPAHHRARILRDLTSVEPAADAETGPTGLSVIGCDETPNFRYNRIRKLPSSRPPRPQRQNAHNRGRSSPQCPTPLRSRHQPQSPSRDSIGLVGARWFASIEPEMPGSNVHPCQSTISAQVSALRAGNLRRQRTPTCGNGIVHIIEADLNRLRTREVMRIAKAKGWLRGTQPRLNPRQEAHTVAFC